MAEVKYGLFLLKCSMETPPTVSIPRTYLGQGVAAGTGTGTNYVLAAMPLHIPAGAMIPMNPLLHDALAAGWDMSNPQEAAEPLLGASQPEEPTPFQKLLALMRQLRLSLNMP